jgi:hypothetical protein
MPASTNGGSAALTPSLAPRAPTATATAPSSAAAAAAARSPAVRQLLDTPALPIAPDGAARACGPLAAAVAPFLAPGSGRIPCAAVVVESIERALRTIWPVGSVSSNGGGAGGAGPAGGGNGNARRALLTLLCSQALAAAEEAARAAAIEADGERRLPPPAAAAGTTTAGGIGVDALSALLPPSLQLALHGSTVAGGAPPATLPGLLAPALSALEDGGTAAGAAAASAAAAAAAATMGDGSSPLDDLDEEAAILLLMQVLQAAFPPSADPDQPDLDRPMQILLASRLDRLGPSATWACACEALQQHAAAHAAHAAHAGPHAAGPMRHPPLPPVQLFLELTRPSRSDPELLLQLAAAWTAAPPPLRAYQERVRRLFAMHVAVSFPCWFTLCCMQAAHKLPPTQSSSMPVSFQCVRRIFESRGANWVVVAPTGSGKTRIAVEVAS